MTGESDERTAFASNATSITRRDGRQYLRMSDERPVVEEEDGLAPQATKRWIIFLGLASLALAGVLYALLNKLLGGSQSLWWFLGIWLLSWFASLALDHARRGRLLT
jgi:hypothetical protein